MKLKVLSSGSKGNCYILTDIQGRSLVVECGVKFSAISKSVPISSIDACIISHEHKDHSLSKSTLEENCVKVFAYDTISCNKTITVGDWIILPIEAFHNAKCFSFMIYHKKEQKKILFVTDSKIINPKIANVKFDCVLLEANYSMQYIIDNYEKITNFGYLNHLSIESVCEWLETRKFMPKTTVLIHLSESGNISEEIALNAVKSYATNTYIAKPNIEVEI